MLHLVTSFATVHYQCFRFQFSFAKLHQSFSVFNIYRYLAAELGAVHQNQGFRYFITVFFFNPNPAMYRPVGRAFAMRNRCRLGWFLRACSWCLAAISSCGET